MYLFLPYCDIIDSVISSKIFQSHDLVKAFIVYFQFAASRVPDDHKCLLSSFLNRYGYIFPFAKSNLCTSPCRLSSSWDMHHQCSRLSPLLCLASHYCYYIVITGCIACCTVRYQAIRNHNQKIACVTQTIVSRQRYENPGAACSAELHRVSGRRRGRPLVSTNVKTRFGIFQKLLAQRERDAEWGARVARASKKASETSALDNVWTCRRRHATFVHWDFNADASTRTRKSIMEYVVNMKIGKRSLYRGKHMTCRGASGNLRHV